MRALITGLAGLALFASTPAHAARHEVSFEFFGNLLGDAAWDSVWSPSDLPSFGIRGGYAVLRDKRRLGLVIDAGWARGVRGTSVDTGSDASLRAAFDLDTFTLGAKGDVDVGNIFYPYLHAQVALLRSTSFFDDRPYTANNTNQLTRSAVAPAGVFTVGFDLMVPDRKLGWPMTFAIFVEGGYQVAGALRFDDVGGDGLDLSGPVFRTGIGLRI